MASLALRGAGFTLDKIVSSSDRKLRKSKVVCTMGPACWSFEQICSLIEAGMNIARLNFSHGDHDAHRATVEKIMKARAKLDRPVAIMLDTKGPEIRTGFFTEECGGKISLKRGDKLRIVTDYSFKGDSTCIACTYKSLATSVKPGNTILVADGSLTLVVDECDEDSGEVVCTIGNDCSIGERKNMNLPGVKVDLPVITEKDERDLLEFACRQPIDFIAASFVTKASDIKLIRKTLGPRARSIKIIAKIENQEGLENYDEILAETDGIMVARGDLGMEIAPEKVFLAQKMMIRKANVMGKPVITATQMLESMINNPRPTRAECTDVANAVLDGSDCVMLSGETASGSYPLAAVQMMASVCVEAESCIDYNKIYLAVRGSHLDLFGKMEKTEAIASSAVKTAMDMGAAAILVLTDSGNTARLVAKYRPEQPILVLTASQTTAHQVFGSLRGCTSKAIGSMIGTDSILARACDMLRDDLQWAKPGDFVVAVHGQLEARSGSTNMLKVITVS